MIQLYKLFMKALKDPRILFRKELKSALPKSIRWYEDFNFQLCKTPTSERFDEAFMNILFGESKPMNDQERFNRDLKKALSELYIKRKQKTMGATLSPDESDYSYWEKVRAV